MKHLLSLVTSGCLKFLSVYLSSLICPEGKQGLALSLTPARALAEFVQR